MARDIIPMFDIDDIKRQVHIRAKSGSDTELPPNQPDKKKKNPKLPKVPGVYGMFLIHGLVIIVIIVIIIITNSVVCLFSYGAYLLSPQLSLHFQLVCKTKSSNKGFFDIPSEVPAAQSTVSEQPQASDTSVAASTNTQPGGYFCSPRVLSAVSFLIQKMITYSHRYIGLNVCIHSGI